MPVLGSSLHGSSVTGDSLRYSSMDSQLYQTSTHGFSLVKQRHPKTNSFNGSSTYSSLAEPNLSDLVETEVFVGDDADDAYFPYGQSSTDGHHISSPLVISYQKEPFLKPLNSVKEEIEAEAAEEELSGNYHSLDYLSLGHSSLSSSIISSTSVDDNQDLYGIAKSSSTPMSFNSLVKSALDDNASSRPCRQYFRSNSSDKNSPVPAKNIGRCSPGPCSTPEANASNVHSRFQCREQNLCLRNNHSKCHSMQHECSSKSAPAERRAPIWHNPSKSDRILPSERDGYTLFKRDKDTKSRSDAVKVAQGDTKFNSLPRRKERKTDKEIAAETFGTLIRNRRKPSSNDTTIKSNGDCSHSRDISHDTKNTLDKYATLPRRKAMEASSRLREQAAKDKREQRPILQRSKSAGKNDSQPSKASPALVNSLGANICSRIFSSPSKTSPVTSRSAEKPKESSNSFSRLFPKRNSSLKGKTSSPSKHNKLDSISKKSAGVQVDISLDPNDKDLYAQYEKLTDEYSSLQKKLLAAEANAREVEELRMEANELRKVVDLEKQEKEELQEELDRTSTRVKDMLVSMEGVEKEFNKRGDSLIELEGQLQTTSDVNYKLQDKVNQSEDFAVRMGKDLDKSLAAQKILLQQVQDLEAEGREMAEFMAEEKNILSDCLREAETEVGRVRKDCEELSRRLLQKDEEARHMVRLAEERRKEFLSLQSEMCSIQTQSQDLLVYQGAEVSGTSAGLANIISRIQILNQKLIEDYIISEDDIENVVVSATEADDSISSSTYGSAGHPKSPNRVSSFQQKPAASFMQSFLAAIRASQISSRRKALEDRKSPDGSESLRHEEIGNGDLTTLKDYTLLDQVTELDVIFTRFLKVCCVLKTDADGVLRELEDDNERHCNQLQLQQRMIDEQYCNFECISKFETSARKELKIISKDLQIANETFVKICEEGHKIDYKQLEEELDRISCTVRNLECLHADKERKVLSALRRFTHAHGHDLGAMLLPDHLPPRLGPGPLSVNGSAVPHPHQSHSKNRGRKPSPGYKEDGDDQATATNEVDLIINHVLKTLESVPDVVSTCRILKDLYVSLNAQDYLNIKRISSPTKGSPPEVDPAVVDLVAVQIPYDCNANPDTSGIGVGVQDHCNDFDTNVILPLLTNETAL